MAIDVGDRRLRPLLQRARTVARQVQFSLWQGPYTSAFIYENGTASQVPVSGSTALAIGAVYRALAIYADLIGTLPVHRFRGEWERLPSPPFVDSPAGIPVGWTNEIGQVIWSLLLRGNAYLIPTSLEWTGYPSTFFVADPDMVTVQQSTSGGVEYRIRYGPAFSLDDLVLVDPAPDELLHIRWQLPPGGFCGIGVLDAAGGPCGAISGAAYTQRYASDLMANPVPPAILTHPLRLNATQASDLQTQWASSVGRARAVPAVLSGGITYTPLTLTASDLQLIESQKWNATNIATFFGLPPYMVGGDIGSSLTYSTVEGENTRLWTDALQPMAVRLQNYIGGAWTPNGQRLRFVPDAILRSQTLDRANVEKIYIENGIMNVDEVRALENLPPLNQTEPPSQPAALPPGGPMP